MSDITLKQVGDVFILDFGDTDNMTTVSWIDDMNDVLEQVESAPGPKALVTTARGKHYSNGLDVGYMSGNPDLAGVYVIRVEGILARLLTFPAPTVAAINGHAFGAGAFLVAVHDQAVMRADRGFICWPEVHLGMPFTRGLTAILRHRLPVTTAHEAMITGRRYGGADAKDAGIVEAVAQLDELVETAVAMVAPLAPTAGENLSGIKKSLHFDAWQALTFAG